MSTDGLIAIVGIVLSSAAAIGGGWVVLRGAQIHTRIAELQAEAADLRDQNVTLRSTVEWEQGQRKEDARRCDERIRALEDRHKQDLAVLAAKLDAQQTEIALLRGDTLREWLIPALTAALKDADR